MNLLFLLSAFLSAFTGADFSVRRPEVVRAMEAQSIAAQPASAAAIKVAQRPVATLPALLTSALLDRLFQPVRLGSQDLWANRRRE